MYDNLLDTFFIGCSVGEFQDNNHSSEPEVDSDQESSAVEKLCQRFPITCMTFVHGRQGFELNIPGRIPETLSLPSAFV